MTVCLNMSREDMERIAAALGATALSMGRGATNVEQVDEALELYMLHKRIVNAIVESDGCTVEECNKTEHE